MTDAPTPLFTPFRLGRHELQHRIVLPPLTRMRADEPHNAPGALNAEYYAQRATPGGLLIGEATWVEPTGKPYARAPGIETRAQIEGWRKVADAVHRQGAVMFLQLWHAGRIAHASTQPGGALPVAPSAIAAQGKIPDASGQLVPLETPRALELGDIRALVAAFAQGARNAVESGLDGVELHAASGYLFEQFLHTCANQRTDAYGGNLENRARALIEVCEAVTGAIGADRVGVRLSPFGVAGDMRQDDPVEVYSNLLERLAPLDLAYLHIIEPRASGVGAAEVNRGEQPQAAALFRPLWRNALISSGGYRADTASHAVAAGAADAIGFGRFFISNPDLPHRIRTGRAFTPYNRATFYTPGPTGYVDYARAPVDS
jgi:N-ethylmaleimide reductase